MCGTFLFPILQKSLEQNQFYIFSRIHNVPIENREAFLEKIQTDPDFKGVCVRSLTRILYVNQMRPLNKRFKICKEIFLTVPVVIYTRKNFYLLDEINSKISLLSSSGLNEYWLYQDVDKEFLNYREAKTRQSLTLENLSGSFHIVLIGSVISFVVFLTELLVFKVKACVGERVFMMSYR